MAWQTFNVTFQDTGNTVTLTAHRFNNGDVVYFTSIVSTTGITANTNYYVINTGENTFQLSLTLGGAAIPLTTNGSGVLHYVPVLSPKNASCPYITLQGVTTKTDIGDGTKGHIRTFNVLGVEPIFEPMSDPVECVGGVTRASRVYKTKLNVKFDNFKVITSTVQNDFHDFLYLTQMILLDEYIAIVATDFLRGDTDTDLPFSSWYINVAIEPIERSKSPNFEDGSDELTIVFQEQTIGDIHDR